MMCGAAGTVLTRLLQKFCKDLLSLTFILLEFYACLVLKSLLPFLSWQKVNSANLICYQKIRCGLVL